MSNDKEVDRSRYLYSKTVKGKPYHRLVIRQAASLQDARALGTLVNKQFPLMSPWAFKTKN